ENDVWRVSAFNPEHNHELALQSERHLLRSSCCITKPKVDVIDTMVNASVNHHWQNVMFGCAFLLDEFWRDGRSRVDYDCLEM
ncbi:hypothetical protein SO802_031372, partial [Lithocarpus litseifolius]